MLRTNNSSLTLTLFGVATTKPRLFPPNNKTGPRLTAPLSLSHLIILSTLLLFSPPFPLLPKPFLFVTFASPLFLLFCFPFRYPFFHQKASTIQPTLANFRARLLFLHNVTHTQSSRFVIILPPPTNTIATQNTPKMFGTGASGGTGGGFGGFGTNNNNNNQAGNTGGSVFGTGTGFGQPASTGTFAILGVFCLYFLSVVLISFFLSLSLFFLSFSRFDMGTCVMYILGNAFNRDMIGARCLEVPSPREGGGRAGGCFFLRFWR